MRKIEPEGVEMNLISGHLDIQYWMAYYWCWRVGRDIQWVDVLTSLLKTTTTWRYRSILIQGFLPAWYLLSSAFCRSSMRKWTFDEYRSLDNRSSVFFKLILSRLSKGGRLPSSDQLNSSIRNFLMNSSLLSGLLAVSRLQGRQGSSDKGLSEWLELEEGSSVAENSFKEQVETDLFRGNGILLVSKFSEVIAGNALAELLIGVRVVFDCSWVNRS